MDIKLFSHFIRIAWWKDPPYLLVTRKDYLCKWLINLLKFGTILGSLMLPWRASAMSIGQWPRPITSAPWGGPLTTGEGGLVTEPPPPPPPRTAQGCDFFWNTLLTDRIFIEQQCNACKDSLRTDLTLELQCQLCHLLQFQQPLAGRGGRRRWWRTSAGGAGWRTTQQREPGKQPFVFFRTVRSRC